MALQEELKKAPTTVREEDSVAAIVDNAVAIHRSAEDVYYAVLWLIAKTPLCGDVIPDVTPERRLVYLRPNRVAKSPGILVRYKIEADECPCIDWVKYYDYDESDAVTPPAYIHKGS